MPIGLKLVTAPAVEPITLTEAKARLRIDGSDEDTDVSALVAECREAAEGECGRAFVTQTWDLFLDDFPWGEIRLPKPPLQSVTWVKYYDADGVQQTMSADDYHVAANGEPGRVMPVLNGYWPAVQYGRPEAVNVRFVCGYGLAASVPNAAKHAIKLILADRYMHRGDDSPTPINPAARRLLHSLEFGEVN